MKKLLFTFATLFVALSATAATVATLGFQPSEVSAAPGETVEVKIMLTGEGDPIKGAQLQWYFYNPAHEALTSFGLEDTNIGNVFQPKYVKFVNGALFSVLNPNCTESTTEDGAFRMIIANLDGSDIFPENILSMCDQAGIEPCLWVIKVQVPANWEDEYATFEFAQTPNYQCMWNLSSGENIDNLQDVAPMVLKIKNANYVPPVVTKDFLGDVNVTVDQATGAVTATYVPAEGEDVEPTVVVTPNPLTEYGVQNVTVTVSADGYNTKEYTKEVNWVKPNADFQGTVTVTVDENGKVVVTYVPAEGEEVPEDMEITVDPATVQPGTTEVTYTVTAEGYNDLTGTANVTYTPLAATPVITFTPGETGVTIDVEPCTSYEVIVNGVNKGQINFVEKDWVAQTIVVNATNAPANYEAATATDTYNLGVKDNYELAGYITIGAVDQSNGKVHVAYIGEEDVTLSVTMNEKREVITINAKEGDIQLPERGVVYEITATAIPVADHYNSLTSDVAERIWNELKVYEVLEPTVVGAQNDDAYVINVTNNDPYATVTLIVTLDGVRTEYTEFPVSIARTENDQYVSFYATATLTEAPAGYDDWTNASTNVQTDWIDALEQPQMKDFLGTVDVTVDENGNITVAYVPAEDEVVPEDMTITYDPTKVTESGTYTVNYTVKAEGYNDKTGSAEVTYTKPVVPVEQTNSPSVHKYNEIIWDAPHQCHNEYHISYTNAESDPDATIYYAVGVGTYDEATDTWTFEYQKDENGNIIYMEYVDELIYTTPGTYEITAYAITPGKTASNTVVDRFTVASTTSVEELFADKTLAGVRYFNLAGQEMQEANGICISVYTFTDGTQVAVKVMQ